MRPDLVEPRLAVAALSGHRGALKAKHLRSQLTR